MTIITKTFKEDKQKKIRNCVPFGTAIFQEQDVSNIIAHAQWRWYRCCLSVNSPQKEIPEPQPLTS